MRAASFACWPRAVALLAAAAPHRADLARQADQVRRLCAGGQLARRARPHDRRQAQGSARPAGRRREQARRRRHRRDRRGREGRRPTATRWCSGSTVRSRSARCCRSCPTTSQKDLAPVIITTSQPNVLAVNASLPVKSAGRARRVREGQPGQAQLRIGRQRQLVASQHGASEVGCRVRRACTCRSTARRRRSPRRCQGETQMMFAVMQPLQPQIQAGKLRALAVTTAKRFPLLARPARRSRSPAIPASRRSRGTA